MDTTQEMRQRLEGHVEVSNDMHSYKLVVPKYLFEELRQLAESEHTNISDLIRRYLKLGLKITNEQDQGAELILRHPDGTEEQILFVI